MEESIIRIKSLKKYFPVSRRVLFYRNIIYLRAVDDVSLTIQKGEVLGLVGESGCGKTTLGRLILGLDKPTSGEIYYAGLELSKLKKKQLRKLRKEIQMIFQNPFSSLNPRIKVGRILEIPLINFGMFSLKERENKVKELLEVVGLEDKFSDRYPHEFSGGQRQRIGIARALAPGPKFIVADEPISSLDVSIQAQILNLLKDLQEQLDLTYLFITHDLRVVCFISDRVAVMYLGKIVELADTKELFSSPLHPYTHKLLSSAPIPDPQIEAKKEIGRVLLRGEVPSPLNIPSGCRFHTRCDKAEKVCTEVDPELIEMGNNHYLACNLI